MADTKNPRWMHLINQLLDSPANAQRSDRDNTVMMNVLEPIIRNLKAGVALSDRQAAALVDNIRRRVPGRHDFTWEGPIILTKEQRRGLRNRARKADEASANNTQTTPKPHLNHTEITPKPHRNNTETTPGGPANPYAVSVCGRSTILNSTELHSTRGFGHSLIARGPDQNLDMIIGGGIPPEEDQERPAEEVLSQLGFASISTSEEIQRDVTQGVAFNPAQAWTEEERLAVRENALQGLAELGDAAVRRDTGKRPQGPLEASVKLGQGASVDIWCDGISTCRGELQFMGARYGLNFSPVLGAEERLSQARREPGDWSFGDMVAAELIRPWSRRAISAESPAHRFAASPVFMSNHLNTGIFRQMFVALEWEGQTLKGAIILNGPDFYTVRFAVNDVKNPKAPDYKGKAIAA